MTDKSDGEKMEMTRHMLEQVALRMELRIDPQNPNVAIGQILACEIVTACNEALATIAALQGERDEAVKLLAEQGVAITFGPTHPMPDGGWACFHCGARFATQGAARRHFGNTPDGITRCQSMQARAEAAEANARTPGTIEVCPRCDDRAADGCFAAQSGLIKSIQPRKAGCAMTSCPIKALSPQPQGEDMSDTQTATMHDLGHGLKLSVGRDGAWLHFAAEGKQCMVHVHNALGTGSLRGPGIISQTIDAWCAEREAADRLAPQATAGRPDLGSCPSESSSLGGVTSTQTAPLPPDIAQIEKRHAKDQQQHDLGACFIGLSCATSKHADRAALLAHIRSRQGVVNRAALITELNAFLTPKHAIEVADALIASGVVKAAPSRQEIADALIGEGTGRDKERLQSADAILALFK